MENLCADTCHANGCDQCTGGTTIFKRNFVYFCEFCHDIFGEACLHCQDFSGCAQCDTGYERVQDSESLLYYCIPTDGTSYTVINCGAPINDSVYPDHKYDPSCVEPPTYSPTPPTKPPSPYPTPEPTPQPTPGPTPEPTSSPTPDPTPHPTPEPSPNPTNVTCFLFLFFVFCFFLFLC